MNRSLLKTMLGLAVVGLAVVTFAPPAEATCGFSRSFGNYPSAGPCGTACYVFAQSDGAGTSNIIADYWVLGAGDPAAGSGRDNGNYEWDGTNGGGQRWGTPYPNEASTNWLWNSNTENGTTDGCPSGNEMVAVITDTDGSQGYYAFACAIEDTAAGRDYDFGFSNSITLQPIPAMTITSSSRAGQTLTVNVSWTNNATDAFYNSRCVDATLGAILTGWGVFKQEVAQGGSPTGTDTASWSRVGGAAGSGAASASVTFDCGAANEAFLALVPEFDGGFATGHVGPVSTRIECDPNQADPTPRFKLIDRKDDPGRVTPKKK